jgi:pyridoxal/pyridoxine/pyridoxamine kinase
MGEFVNCDDPRLRATALLIVIRYVGNTMATFVLQSLGCDVAALNTVHFSRSAYEHKLDRELTRSFSTSSLLYGDDTMMT